MKKVSLLALLAWQSAAALFSQTQTGKSDTMSIRIGGEHITLPVPKEGNKTTINLEDSANIIQISVAKTSKLRSSKIPPVIPVADEHRKKVISWFNEVDFGITSLVGRYTQTVNDTVYGFQFSSGITNNNTNNRATMIRMTPKTINAGFSIGFTIREKRRFLGKSNIAFITGSRFRYSRFTGKGQYEFTEIKATYDNGVKYYPDSVYSYKSGEYRTATSSYQLLFPFMFETTLKKNSNIRLSAGLNLSVNIHSTRFTEDVRSKTTVISYINPQLLQFQPIIKASYKRTSVYLSLNPGRTRIGYGSTHSISGNTLYFGLAYKLY
jgi:hypothetical protein